MKILVVGGGAREHAILWKLRQSALVSKLFVTPGNAGMEQLAECVSLDDDHPDAASYADLAERLVVDLTVIGPENLLVEGLVDHFQQRGLRVFGPTAAAARLEGSKIWAKEVMQRVGIPTASWRAFSEFDDALSHAHDLEWRCAIKADGLASGKGSFVCKTVEEVTEALHLLLTEKRFGNKPVIVEELLDGQEVSVFALSDGRTVVPFGAAQDHKRARDRDEGPNTGGMGAYSPVNHMKVAQDFAGSFFQPIVNDLSALKTPYVGVLYAGAIVTAQGPKILEFNCRFGDPEAEVLLCRLDGDLAEILWAATECNLHKLAAPGWKSKDALCVVISTEKYPQEADFGTQIYGVEEAGKVEDVIVFHAGTSRDPTSQELVTHGGRILSVTGMGNSLEEARTRAYKAVEKIHFEGMYFRKDIASKADGIVWETEWRKPPRWERQVMGASLAIGRVANNLEKAQFEVGGDTSSDVAAQIQTAREELYEIKLTLSPGQSSVPITDRSGDDEDSSDAASRLSSLSAEFDALLERMQSPEARLAVDAVFRASPKELGAVSGAPKANRRRE